MNDPETFPDRHGADQIDGVVRVTSEALSCTKSEPHRCELRRRGLLVAVAGVLPVAALIAVPLMANASAPPAPPAGWTTVFSDDFNGTAGTAPSSANWIYDLGTSYPGGAGNWGTGEVESNTNSTSQRLPRRRRPPGDQADQGRDRQLDVGPHRDRAHRLRGAGRRPDGDLRVDRAAEPGHRPRLLAGVLGDGRGRPSGRRDQLAEHRRARHHGGRQRAVRRCRTRSTVESIRAARATRPPASAAACSAAAAARPAYHTYSVIVDRTQRRAPSSCASTPTASLQLTVNQSQVDATTWTERGRPRLLRDPERRDRRRLPERDLRLHAHRRRRRRRARR